MHVEAMEWVRRQTGLTRWGSVLEIGSRDVNGTPRSVVRAARYIGVDIEDGAGVDVVADCSTPYGTWGLPEGHGLFDLVIACEVFEHTPNWRMIWWNMVDLVKLGGRLLVTTACEPREPHSGVDGSPLRLMSVNGREGYVRMDEVRAAEELRKPLASLLVEYYGNVDPQAMFEELVERLPTWTLDVLPRGDLRVAARTAEVAAITGIADAGPWRQ